MVHELRVHIMGENTMSESSLTAKNAPVRQRAKGRWRDILPQLGIAVPATAEKKGPCPACGGKDRFRFDDKNGSGSWFCNQCEPQSGNGFYLVMSVKGVDMKEAQQLVEDTLILLDNGHAKPEEPSSVPPSSSSQPPGELGRTLFAYHHADGRIALFVQRLERPDGKAFPQWGPTAQGTGWQPKLEHVKKPKPLYRLPEILKRPGEVVVVHEGEKAVEAHLAAQLPGIPTTSSGGAKNTKHSDWSSLKDRRVVVCLDNDDDGERYGHDIQQVLSLFSSVELLRLPNLPAKGDVVEWLEAGGTPAQFEQLLDQLGAKAAPPVVMPLADTIIQVEALLLRYISFPSDRLALLIAFWVALTYAFESVQYCGFLVLKSPTPRCGKTKLMRLLSRLVNGTPQLLCMPTPASIFRSDDKVLIVDEADRLRETDKEMFGVLMAVLNCGFERGAVVPRINRQTGHKELFSVYGPKILGGIESIADTLADRSFMIPMLRSTVRMPRLNLRKLEPTLAGIRLMLQQYVDRHKETIVERYESLPDMVSDLEAFDERFQDLCEPLVVLGEIADAEQPTGLRHRLIEAFEVAIDRREPVGREAWFLSFLDLVEDRIGQADSCFVETQILLELFDSVEDLASIETGHTLAAQLKHFDLSPRQNPAGSKRGYLISREWVGAWRSRYPRQEAL
jgi:hypothetical protein